MNGQGDLASALAPVVAALEALEIRYCVGGSVASSFHGAARATMDVDLLCELTNEHVSTFLASFDTDFYVSESAIREAVERKSCFNLIHLPTSFKVDVFISRDREFDRTRMRRASRERLPGEKPVAVLMTSAEDSVISKLEWFRSTRIMHRPQAGPNKRRLFAGAAFAIARAINVHTVISRMLRLCSAGSDLREFVPAYMNNPAWETKPQNVNGSMFHDSCA